MTLTKEQQLAIAQQNLERAQADLARNADEVTKDKQTIEDNKARDLQRITDRTTYRQTQVDFWLAQVALIQAE